MTQPLPFADVSAWTEVATGRFAGAFPSAWTQGRSVFGGLQGAVMLRAMERAVEPGRRCRSFNLTCCAPVQPTEGTCEVAPLRSGRHVSTVEATLRQGGDAVARAVAAFGADRDSAIVVDTPGIPSVPPPESVPRVPPATPGVPRFVDELDLRVFEGIPYSGGSPSVSAWVRLSGARTLGAPEIVALCDAPPPAPVVMASSPVPSSTVDLTIQLLDAAPPDPNGWFLYRSRCTWALGGYAEVQATLWSQSGPAVARIRQLVAVFG